ncbi:hypothetical protein J4232_04435 [Candidatus Woesearchaeota archaeon]|nr:hypothetical protein [Candidatus Woesearchaeota archaeon]
MNMMQFNKFFLKKKKFMHKSLALFMICLVLTLPFFSAGALAVTGQIEEVAYSGDVGIPGYMNAKDDALHVQILASKDAGETTNKDIVIEFNQKQVNADKCEAVDELSGISNKYVCSYTSEKKWYAPGKMDLIVKLVDKPTVAILDSEVKEVFIDGYGPEISLDIPSGTKDSFTLKYDIKDKICKDCSQQCVGLYQIFLTVNGNIADQQDVSDQNLCDYSFNEEKSIGDLNLEFGKNEICVVAVDKLGNIGGKDKKKGECKTITVDSTAPIFDENSFVIFDDKTGLVVNFRKDTVITATIKVNVTDDQTTIKPQNVEADFSALNPAYKSEYKAIKPNQCKEHELEISSEQSISLYECTWNKIKIAGNLESDNIPVAITAKDASENAAVFSKALSLPIDAVNPKVVKIIALSENGQQIKYLNGDNNTIALLIDEQGAGLAKADVYIKINGKESKAARCIADNGWICLFENVQSLSGQTGDSKLVSVVAEKSSDDIGNLFDDKGDNKEIFLLDVDAPEFPSKSISIIPKGVERDTLVNGDIVEIKALIKEKGAGLSGENVYADITAFDPSLEGDAARLQADDCAVKTEDDTSEDATVPASAAVDSGADGGIDDGTDAEQIPEDMFSDDEQLYECTFEYTGNIAAQDISLEIIANDNAGNQKKSSDDDEYGKIKAVEVVQKKADFFADSLVIKADEINRNHLWMSDAGAIVRAEITLQAKGGKEPYVHGFRLGTCTGMIDTEKSLNASTPITFNEYGVPEVKNKGRRTKLILLTLPTMDKKLLKDAKTFIVTCDGAITQSSSKNSNIFSPDELFQAVVTIQIGSSVYNPGDAALNKIIEGKTFVDVMDAIISVLEPIVDILSKICEPINDIRTIINNICAIINSIAIILTGTPWGEISGAAQTARGNDNTCTEIGGFMDKLWQGWTGKDPEPGAWNEKSFASIGYWCDLVLCTSCSEQWGSNILNGWGGDIISPSRTFGSNLKDNPEAAKAAADFIRLPGDPPNLGDFTIGINLDPHQSLIVALICSPPCLPTIKNKLTAMKQIAVSNNVCRNLAYRTTKTDKAPADFSKCDGLVGQQVCQFIAGELWYIVPALITQFAQKWISYFLEKGLRYIGNCPDGISTSSPGTTLCIVTRLEIAISTAFKITETAAKFEKLAKDFSFDTKSVDDTQKDIEDEYEKAYGEIPEE